METKDIKLETLGMWLVAHPGSSFGCNYTDGGYDCRLTYRGRTHYGRGKSIERALYWVFDSVRGIGGTQAFASMAVDA